MSAYSLDPTLVTTLKSFVDMLKSHPAMLASSDLGFFRDYLKSVGAKIPTVAEEDKETGASGSGDNFTKSNKPTAGGPEPSKAEVIDEEMDSDPEEPFPELPQDGVIEEEEADPSQDMGNADAEPSEENMDKSNELKMEAVGLFSEGNYQECVNKYTEAIKLNGQSGALFAKRGQAYLRLQKPNACIKDCTRALEINPDSAVAYKFRGRARRLLGHWEESAADLRQACKIDMDEQTDEWLKEVQPHARKVEEWRLRKKRRDEEKEIKLRKQRAQQRAQAHANAHKEEKHEPSADDFLGSIPGLSQVMNDPEVKLLFDDPEVAAAFSDIGQNPANILKYQSNPKVAKLLQLLQKKMGMGGMGGGMGGMGGMPGGMGGMGGMPGGMGGMPGGMGGMPGGMGGMPGGMGGMPGGMGGMGGMPGGFPGMPGGMGGFPGMGGFGGADPTPPGPKPKPPPGDDLD